jgi:hypothetical protein
VPVVKDVAIEVRVTVAPYFDNRRLVFRELHRVVPDHAGIYDALSTASPFGPPSQRWGRDKKPQQKGSYYAKHTGTTK